MNDTHNLQDPYMRPPEIWTREQESRKMQEQLASQGCSPTHWQLILSSTWETIQSLATLKGGEYAGDLDRLANFRQAATRLGLPMETVWAVYASKHWDALLQYIRDQREGVSRQRAEPIESRIDDLLVYLLLFKAMLSERKNFVPPKGGPSASAEERLFESPREVHARLAKKNSPEKPIQREEYP